MDFGSIFENIPVGIVIAIVLAAVFWATAFRRREDIPGRKSRPYVRSTIGLLATLGLIALTMTNVGPNGGLWSTLPELTKIFTLGILAIWAYIFFYRFTPLTIAHAPTVLTTLGIFGTFVGIAWGLSGFNVNSVQESIPILLDGLKTSFWASVVGVGGAVSIKMKHLIIVSFKEDKTATDYDATIDDVASLLRALNNSLRQSEQTTVVSELMLMRRDSNERLDSLRKAFEEFMKRAHAAEHVPRMELPRRTS